MAIAFNYEKIERFFASNLSSIHNLKHSCCADLKSIKINIQS